GGGDSVREIAVDIFAALEDVPFDTPDAEARELDLIDLVVVAGHCCSLNGLAGSAAQAARIDAVGVPVEMAGDGVERGPAGAGARATGEPSAGCSLLAQAIGGVFARLRRVHAASAQRARRSSAMRST